MTEPLIVVQQVSKKFCRNLKKSLWYGIQDLAYEMMLRTSSRKNVLRSEEFWAVNEVSFELSRGQCLGLLGRNGAGKTTLLKMLNGLVRPDVGRIEMRGSVSALIALGAGFNPILTGRENIYVNGSILGLSERQIDNKLDSIIEFAEIEEFIDTPVMNYSSGMQVRLGFAVATALEPDILLIDEVLAVGDVGFRSKCYDVIERLRPRTAIILVSHNRQDIIRTCTEALVLTRGLQSYLGDVVSGITSYESHLAESEKLVHHQEGITLHHVQLVPNEIMWRDSVKVRLGVFSNRFTESIKFRVSIMNHAHECVAEWRSEHHIPPLVLQVGLNEFVFDLADIHLQSGAYFCNFILSKDGDAQYLLLAFNHQTLYVNGTMRGIGPYQI